METVSLCRSYRSRIGAAFMLLPAVVSGGGTLSVIAGSGIIPAIPLLVADIFVIYLFVSIKYIIRGDTLYIRGGFIFRRQIKIKDIQRVLPTWTMLAAPAASPDRLKITGRFGSVVISPEKGADFIHDLKDINPDIEFV